MSATRQRVVIKPLKEELENLGILEQDDEEPAPEPDPEGGYSAPDIDDKPADEPDVGTEDVDEPGDDDDEDDVEAEAVAAISTLSNHFLGTHESDDGEMPVDEPEDEPEGPEGEPVGESRMARLRRLSEGKIHGRPKSAAARKHDNKISALLEDVSGIVGDIHRVRREERIKGFAGIAVIAEMLSRRFHNWGMALSEGSLYRVGDVMKGLFEQAADIAIEMDTPPGEEMPDEEPPPEPIASAAGGDEAMVDEMFKKLMAKLLDALQLYNDVTGKGGEEGGEPMAASDEIPGDEDEVDVDIDVDDEEPLAAADEIPGDDDELPPPGPPVDDEPEDEPEEEDDDEEEPEPPPMGACRESDDDEGPYGNPSGDEDEPVAEARAILAGLRRRLSEKKKVLKGGKGKKGKKPLKSASAAFGAFYGKGGKKKKK